MGASFTYKPDEQGWADCAIETATGRAAWIEARAAGEALRDLLMALTALMHGAAEARVEILEIPEHVDLSFTALGDGAVRLVIERFPNWFERRRNGVVLFDEPVRLRTLAGSVASACQALIERFGEAGYRGWRGANFPAEALAGLRAALKSGSGLPDQ